MVMVMVVMVDGTPKPPWWKTDVLSLQSPVWFIGYWLLVYGVYFFGGKRGGTLNSTPFFGGKRDTQYSVLNTRHSTLHNRRTIFNIHMTMTTTPLHYSITPRTRPQPSLLHFFWKLESVPVKGCTTTATSSLHLCSLIKVDDALFIVPSSNHHLLRRRPLNK